MAGVIFPARPPLYRKMRSLAGNHPAYRRNQFMAILKHSGRQRVFLNYQGRENTGRETIQGAGKPVDNDVFMLPADKHIRKSQ